ncbi:Octaprenyl-diphosphate synthase [Rosistilla carotiformis]|uniref:Octaprenyl-diphosphate synthase n=1 Tax=Rosistilla carotiformis TaxID=2528017 RepID=A0A518JZH3_9BACT|nr:polyprenyl synthetase family protein [Rosistilla carotiformis]QDV70944.1 Octaprenyl-diphosphate synthase [Rosistilla carotiformis]
MDTQTTLSTKQSTANSLRERADSSFECIRDEMQLVEQLLREQMQSEYEDLSPLLAHGALLGGKRLRPALVLLAGKAAGELTGDHVVLGTVMEMIHTATLIHDDVLDSADQRRHLPTVNAKWNDQTSILLGDYLFAQAFTLSATLGSTQACQWIGDAARRVCEGELRQIFTSGCSQLSEVDYIDIIRGKTAELCRISCRLGGTHGGADLPTQTALADFGENLGIAFQIADDFLDVWGSTERVGKTLGTDLLQGKPTLPLIHLLQSDPSMQTQLDELQSMSDAARCQAIVTRLEQSDAKAYTLATAQRFAADAVAAIDFLPESAAKKSLQQLALFSVSRNF